jgi:hypothetical protein
MAATTTFNITPLSASDCNPAGALLNTYSECTQVIGGGLEINSISGKLINFTGFTLNEVHIQIYGPQGSIYNCAQYNIKPYATGPTCTCKNPQPSKQWPAGDYCSRAWEYAGDGSYADLSNECIDVHA